LPYCLHGIRLSVGAHRRTPFINSPVLYLLQAARGHTLRPDYLNYLPTLAPRCERFKK